MEGEMNELINVTMDNIKSMMDSENIVGKPIMMPEGNVVIPISKVTVGFVTGGGQYGGGEGKSSFVFPFAGGGGGGINITPIGFLVCDKEDTNLIKIDKKESEGKWENLISAAMNLFKHKK